MMRVVYGLLAALMLLFAAVQYNDPDGLMWMVFYTVPALWCAAAAFWRQGFARPFVKPFLLVFIAASLYGVFYFWPLTPRFWTKDIWFEVETAREGMGMMIVAAVLFSVWLGRRARY